MSSDRSPQAMTKPTPTVGRVSPQGVTRPETANEPMADVGLRWANSIYGDGWIETTIGEQVTLQRGFDITKATQQSGAVPVISSGGINSYHNVSQARGPGVVLGRKGVVGSVYFVRDDYWPHDTTLWVKDFHGNDALFTYYFFRARASDLAALDVGSANPTLNRNHVHPMKTLWPPLNEQQAIAAFLGILDDRIALLRETNATLEAIAQALFKSWFVDFDPVRARQQGLAPEGMDEATAALFPDGFEESELGWVPKGWKVGSLANLMRLHKGSINPGAQPDAEFQHFSLPAFDAGQMPIQELGGAIKSNKTTVPEDGVLMSKLNPHIPRVWLPSVVGENAVCSTEFLPFVPTGPSTTAFVYSLLTTPNFSQALCQLVTGTSNSHQRVKPDGVLSMPGVIPPAEVVAEFDAVTNELLARVKANRQKAQTLSILRDTLLPRLISGQLRLPEVADEN